MKRTQFLIKHNIGSNVLFNTESYGFFIVPLNLGSFCLFSKNSHSLNNINKSYYSTNSGAFINIDELVKQLPDIIRNNDILFNELVDTLNKVNSIVSLGEIQDLQLQTNIRDEILLLLYKLGVDESLVGKFVEKIKVEDIVINNITFEELLLQAESVFEKYNIEPSNQLRSKLELLFIVLYNVRKLPGINRVTVNEINSVVTQLSSRISPDSVTVSVYKRNKGLVNKSANPSQIRGKIMNKITILINNYKDIIHNKVSQVRREVEITVLNAFNSVVKPVEKNTVNSLKEFFTYDSAVSSKNRVSSHLSEMDEAFQNRLLDFITSQPLTSSDEILEILSEIDVSSQPSRRVNALAFDTPYCQGVTKILKAKLLRPEDKQYLLEKFALEYELNFFKYNLAEQGSMAKMALFKECHIKLIKAIDLLVDRYTINDYKQLIKLGPSGEAKIALLLILYDKEKLASIIFGSLMKLLSNASSESVVKVDLSMEVAEQVLKGFRYIKKNPFPEELKIGFAEYVDLKFLKSIGPMEKSQLGLALVEFVLEKLPIITFKTITVNKQSETVVEFHPDFEKIISRIGMDPMKLPMVCPPLMWKSDKPAGGYLTSAVRYFNNKDSGFVHQNVFNRFDSEPSQIQYDAINHLNRQAFVINKDVLNFILSEWDKADGLFGEFNKEHSLTSSDLSPLSKAYKIVQAHNSLYWIYRNIINLAIMFEGNKFYLPTFMDFRGRIYPYVSYLSYQGNDLARALLNFADSEPITENGLEYLQLYLASTYGKTSDTFEKRLEWFNENFDNFYNLYLEEPERFEKEVLSQANEKFQFMSVFLTFVRLLTKGVETPVGTPILFDCSCSGMQHLSALCSNLTLAKMVNVIPAEGRSDFYSIAAEYVSDAIKNSEDRYKENLSKVNINRAVMKIPVMTIPYNISLSGITEKLESTIVLEKIFEHKKCYYKIDPDFIRGQDKVLCLTASEFGVLSRFIYNSLYDMIPSLKLLTEFLNSLVKLLQKVDKPVIWITPSHLKINLSARNFVSVRTKTKLFKAAKPITISIPGEGYDYKAIQRGFIANFIHSLDAANIHILIKMLKDLNLDNIPLYTIHDCFATTPNNMSILNKVVLSAFVKLYFDSNYIENLNNNIIAQICSYGYEIEEKEGQKYLMNRSEESDELIPLPSIPDELLTKWELNKKVFEENIKNSTYFIS